MFATFVASLPLLRIEMGRGYHFNEDVVWLPGFGIHYHVAIDGISLWLVLLTTFISPLAAFASFGPIEKRLKDWCFALLLLEGGMLGTFLALDLFVFYVFWELMLIPMYVIIGVWGGTNRIRSAIKFFLYTMFGSILMLGAILYLAYAYARVSGGPPSFDYFELQRLYLPRHVQIWLWAAFALAFVIKVPMFPVHTWLPDAHTEAPTAGSVLLAAVMLKMGTYGYLRFCMGLFPRVVYRMGCRSRRRSGPRRDHLRRALRLKQDDVKRLIAYSSVAHLGYVMLGLFAVTQASLEGSVLQMVNHGISTGMLFLLFGVIYDRRHTRHIDEFGGLAKPMPAYAALFVVATLASVGLPGTNGFIGEFLVITGAFASNKLGQFNGLQAVGAAIGVILGAIYMLKVVQKMFFGPVTKKENRRLADLNARELLALAPLTMMIFAIGLFPNVFLTQIRGAASRIVSDYDARLENNPGPKYYEGPLKLALAPARGTAGGSAGPDVAADGSKQGTLTMDTMALALSPLLIVGVGALLLMLAEVSSRRGGGLALGAAVILLAGAVFAAGVWMFGVENLDGATSLAPWLIVDRFTLFFDVLLCLGGALAALLAGGYMPEHQLERGEFYALLLFTTFGAMTLASAGDALTLFLGLETMSIGAYAMTAFRRASARSAEGALKYFLLGSFAAAIFLYGFALLYGATGRTDLAGIGAAVKTGAVHNPLLVLGAALVLVGIRIQNQRRSFSRMDPRRVRGSSHAGDGVHGRRGEGRRIRDVATRAYGVVRRWGVDIVGRRLASGRGYACRADDDGGQFGRRAARIREAYARVFEHRSRRVRAPRRYGPRSIAGDRGRERSFLSSCVYGLHGRRVRYTDSRCAEVAAGKR